MTLSSQVLTEKYFLPSQMARRDQQLKLAKADAKAKKADPDANADPSMTAIGGRPRRDESRPGQQVPPEVREARQGEQNVINELMQAKLLRAAMSERQLEEVLTDFWFNHFNVFVGKGQVRQYLHRVRARRDSAARARQLPRPARRGRAQSGDALLSRQLAERRDPTSGPAMPTADAAASERTRGCRPRSAQLQTRLQQMRASSRRKRPQRGLNENYARELMELHTLGVDGGYTQKDVIELARAF